MRKAFTLIELLILVAIAGIFISLIVNVFKDAPTVKPTTNLSEEKRICERLGLVRKLEDLPIACVKYYK